jgi:hypothetical protein
MALYATGALVYGVQLQDQIGLLEQGVMPTMKGEALMKLADVCAVHYPDMAVKCKNLYTELCNEVYAPTHHNECGLFPRRNWVGGRAHGVASCWRLACDEIRRKFGHLTY